MRLVSIFRKTLREQLRDPLSLVLSLAFAPFFVLIYWLLFPAGSTTYSVMILNQDVGMQFADGTSLRAGEQLVEAVRAVRYADGKPLLVVERITDRAAAESKLKNREATVLVIVPVDFSRRIADLRTGAGSGTAPVVLVGDLTNPQYAVAAIMAGTAADQYVQAATGRSSPTEIVEQSLGASAARTEFENYVPGLLMLAVILLVFAAAMAVTREVEAGTLGRLKLTRMTALDLLGGISAAQVLLGVIGVVLTFLVATALGFRSQGPLWVAILVGAVTSLSIVGMGLLVACVSRTVVQAFLVANFPLALFMFFSGAIYPMPRVSLLSIAGHGVGPYDVLPPTHGVVALNKVLTLGAGLGEVSFELGAVLLLSVAYFTAGIWLFRRVHLRAQ